VRRRLKFLVLGAVLIVGVRVAAQSGTFMDGFLDQPSLRYGPAAYLVLVGARQMSESDPVDSAVGVLQQKGWALPGRGAGDTITLGEYAYLVMRCFAIPGGLMYHLAPGPRYATRELAYLEIIQGRARPDMALTGERAARILGRVLDYEEARP
jgi:hypothetical protein